MLLENQDVTIGLVNGSIGFVQSFEDEKSPVVLFNNGISKIIYATSFEIEQDKEIKAKIYQIPLKLAYAITIHKSQGSTFESIRCNPTKTFDSSQVYVALSRCKSLEGLYFDDFNEKCVCPPEKVLVKFYETLEKIKLNE